MFSATVLGIFFVPLFFVLIRRRFGRVSTATTANPTAQKGDA
jgi:HAE1 family hydrophobic/amphiphilic exporter-1/multidrug efflux pump